MKISRTKKWFRRDILLKAGVILLLALVLLGLILARIQPTETESPYAGNYGYYKAKVIEILYDDAEPDYEYAEGRRIGMQELKIEFTNGPHKGETATVENYLTVLGNVDAKVGMTVVVRYTDYENGNISVVMYNYDRSIALGVILLLFVLAIVLIGGKKGLLSLVGLLFMLVAFWFLLIPLVMRGYNMLLMTVLISALTAASALLLLNGFSKKTYVAVLGCVAGVLVAGLCVLLVDTITPLTGYNMEEAERLIYYATGDGMKISGLLVCGVLISSLGAVMDVAMTISSAIQEVHEADPSLSAKKLFKSGMNVGKDAMGTMSNTLILALFGSSLNTFILTMAYEIPFSQMMNTDFIVVELVRGIAGTIGVILTIPFVAFLCARIMGKREAGHGAKKKENA